MSEIYWKAVSNFSMAASVAIVGYCYYLFVKPFVIKAYNAKIVGTVYMTVMIILYAVPHEFQNFVVYGTGVLISLAIMCLLDRRNYYQKLFLGITFATLRWLSSGMSVIIYKVISDIFFGLPFVVNSFNAQFWAFFAAVIIRLTVQFSFLFFAVRTLLEVYKNKKDNLTIREFIMMSAPGIMGMMIYIMQSFYSDNFSEEISWRIAGIQFVVYGISYITIIAVTYFYQNLKTMEEEKKHEELLLVQQEDMKKYLKEAERNYKDMRLLKHDIVNHIMTLEALYKSNEINEAKAYTDRLIEQLNSAMGEMKSGNPVTDVILMKCFNEAKTKGIEFKSDFHYVGEASIDVFDISVIMNNGLSNAIEAAEGCRHPFIYIRSYCRKNVYMIEIENSFKGEILIDDEKGLPITSKEDKGRHGLGLLNIKAVAKKYHGDIDIDFNKEKFKLSIMLIAE